MPSRYVQRCPSPRLGETPGGDELFFEDCQSLDVPISTTSKAGPFFTIPTGYVVGLHITGVSEEASCYNCSLIGHEGSDPSVETVVQETVPPVVFR
jgi:hypothetical protein